MMDISAKFLGKAIKSPIVVRSGAFSDDLDALRRAEDAGAGAVVLRSVYEEEFVLDIKRNSSVVARTNEYGESYEYVSNRFANYQIDDYFAHVRRIAETLSIPVIGSINCFSHGIWVSYASRYEQAQCDGLELNIGLRPFNTSVTTAEIEAAYTQILQSVRYATQLPISVKVSPFFTNMASFIYQMSWSGVDGITLFDQASFMDIDVEALSLKGLDVRVPSESLLYALQWAAVLSPKVRCGLSIATGVYQWQDVVKSLLVGAEAVQVGSCLCKEGIEHIGELNRGLREWMQRHGFESIAQFRGKNAVKSANVSSTMRVVEMRSVFESTGCDNLFSTNNLNHNQK